MFLWAEAVATACANNAEAEVDSFTRPSILLMTVASTVSGIRIVISPDVDLQKVYVPQWSVTNDSRLDDG
ncbi:hypothetical protein Tco_0029915, partial [Tanacetum coccineum]